MTWEYMFMGMGMKTGTGMGTGTYSLLMPSSTSRETNRVQEKLNKRCLTFVHILFIQIPVILHFN